MSDDERKSRVRSRFSDREDEDDAVEATAEVETEPNQGTSDDDAPRPYQRGTERVSMSLPEDLARRLFNSYDFSKAMHGREYPDARGLEKNRDYFPLVVAAGLDRLGDPDPEVFERYRDEGLDAALDAADE